MQAARVCWEIRAIKRVEKSTQRKERLGSRPKKENRPKMKIGLGPDRKKKKEEERIEKKKRVQFKEIGLGPN
jgi:hypothetical protein